MLRWLAGVRGAVRPAVLVSGGVAATAVAVIVALSASSGGCAVSTPNVPDGPDPWGGCFPGPSNTGPNAPEASMSAYTGTCDITAANVTIDTKVINCQPLRVEVTGTNLIIKNSYLKGGLISDANANPGFTLQDSFLDNAIDYPACTAPSTCAAGKYACGDPGNATVDCGTGYKHYTIKRTEIVNTNRAAYCQIDCLIQDNYFHGTTLWPDHTNLAHASSVRNEQNLTLTHNSLGCDYAGPFPNTDLGCSADMSGYPDFVPIHDDTIQNNLFLANPVGIAYCTYGGATQTKPFSNDPQNATNIKFLSNVWQKGSSGKCGQFGPITDWNGARTGNVQTGNIWDDGSALDLAVW